MERNGQGHRGPGFSTSGGHLLAPVLPPAPTALQVIPRSESLLPQVPLRGWALPGDGGRGILLTPTPAITSLVIFTGDLVVSAHFSVRFNSTRLLRGLELPGREVFANLRFGESCAQNNNSDLNLQPADLQGRGFLVRWQLMGLYSKA